MRHEAGLGLLYGGCGNRSRSYRMVSNFSAHTIGWVHYYDFVMSPFKRRTGVNAMLRRNTVLDRNLGWKSLLYLHPVLSPSPWEIVTLVHLCWKWSHWTLSQFLCHTPRLNKLHFDIFDDHNVKVSGLQNVVMAPEHSLVKYKSFVGLVVTHFCP